MNPIWLSISESAGDGSADRGVTRILRSIDFLQIMPEKIFQRQKGLFMKNKSFKGINIDYTYTENEYKLFLVCCGIMIVLMIDVIAKAMGMGGIF